MSYQAQIDALRDAIAQGAKRITFYTAGTRREVEYHSLKDMRETLDWLVKQETGANRPSVTFAVF